MKRTLFARRPSPAMLGGSHQCPAWGRGICRRAESHRSRRPPDWLGYRDPQRDGYAADRVRVGRVRRL